MKLKNVPASASGSVGIPRPRQERRDSGRNLKLEIEYDGRDYSGWQAQNHHPAKTIQETLEKALHRILQEKFRLSASGRTDAGVHALAQVANFKTDSHIRLDKLQRALNGLLPGDIVVTGIKEVGPEFHSRFSASSKAYRYLILNQPYPCALLRNRVYFCPSPLSLGRMRREARCLLGRHDFKSFCASGSATRDTVRTIRRISVKKLNYPLFTIHYPLIAIDIEADGFLYNMARSIAGTLIEIGKGKLTQGALKKILQAKNRKLAGPTVPAAGLYLVKVNY